MSDNQYQSLDLDRPFGRALICLRCGALVAASAESEGQALHDSFHRRLECLTVTGRGA